jgi:hypothetical protein
MLELCVAMECLIGTCMLSWSEGYRVVNGVPFMLMSHTNESYKHGVRDNTNHLGSAGCLGKGLVFITTDAESHLAWSEAIKFSSLYLGE